MSNYQGDEGEREALLRTAIRRIYAQATQALCEPPGSSSRELIDICDQAERIAEHWSFFNTLVPEDGAYLAPEAKPRKRIAIAALGESFSLEWVKGWTDAIPKLSKHFDLSIHLNYATIVCYGRAALATEILKQPADYVLFMDDDNTPDGSRIVQLIADLEGNQQIDLVAGWYSMALGPEATELSFGRGFRVIKASFQRRYPADPQDFFAADAPELQDIDWTGFGMVLMRWELLKACGPKAFLPEQEGPEEHQQGIEAGFIWDDLHFCKVAKAHGARLFVDRRVRVPHLKLRDITALPPEKGEEAAPAPVAGTDDQRVMIPIGPFRSACKSAQCLLGEFHAGSCYPGTANASLDTQPTTPEVR